MKFSIETKIQQAHMNQKPNKLLLKLFKIKGCLIKLSE
jgi:hypothetical protein